MSNEKIAIVSAVPETLLAFMPMQLQALSQTYLVSAICGKVKSIPQDKKVPNVNYVEISIERNIAPFKDLVSLFRLIKFFQVAQLTAVQSITPKAGLLTMLAAWICRIPIRVHLFTGQVWVTRRGLSRWYLKLFDKLIAFLATNLIADSPSQKNFLVSEGVISFDRISVLGDGSICGVDLTKFRPDDDAKFILRSQLGIPQDATLAIFLGRLKKDKGVLDLAEAFGKLNSLTSNLFLLFAGPDEEALEDKINHLAGSKANQIRIVGSVINPEKYLAAANFLCLPSYREGFGLVTIEAAATGIPTLASRIYGITDAVLDRVTGILHEPGNVEEIATGLKELASNSDLCTAMGVSARKRAFELFSSSRIVDAQINFYHTLIEDYRKNA